MSGDDNTSGDVVESVEGLPAFDASLLKAGLDSWKSSIVICEGDEDCKIVWANKQYLKQTGYELAELLGKDPGFMAHMPSASASGEDNKAQEAKDLIDPQKIKCKQEWIALKKKNREEGNVLSRTMRNWRKDGTPYYNKYECIPFEVSNRKLWISEQHDVTSAKNMKSLLMATGVSLAVVMCAMYWNFVMA